MPDELDTPTAPAPPPAVPTGSATRPLYSEASCLLTTFFATPIGAAPLLMANASRTGQSPLAVGGLALLLTLGVAAIATTTLFSGQRFAFAMVQLGLVRWWYQRRFTTAASARQQEGLAPAPWLHAVLLSLIGFTAQMILAGLRLQAAGLDVLSAR